MTNRWMMACLMLTASCGSVAYHHNGNWTYLNAPGLQPTLLYAFDQPPGKFTGTCDKDPGFLVLDGDWRDGVRRITLSTGGEIMSFENYGGTAKALAMLPDGTTGSAEEAANQKRMEAMLAGATAPIVVSTDNGWTRSVPPSPELGMFITACHAWRKDHPATD